MPGSHPHRECPSWCSTSGAPSGSGRESLGGTGSGPALERFPSARGLSNCCSWQCPVRISKETEPATVWTSRISWTKAKTTGTPRRRVLAGVIVGKHRGQLSRPWVQVAARGTEVIGRGCRGVVEVERIGCLVAAGVDAVARQRGRVELHRTECAVGAGITVEPTMIGVVYDLKCHCHGAACRC
ncbi:MAG: hypothetical protein QOE89_202 [Pseudonocardiales bacterium]|jgi:hypothetical protein|nr:hypothetical protein [Pseudonocardiales bacterium]